MHATVVREKYGRHISMKESALTEQIIGGAIEVELKSVKALEPVHEAQLLTYMKLTGCKIGLLINFNVPVLKQGIKRMVL